MVFRTRCRVSLCLMMGFLAIVSTSLLARNSKEGAPEQRRQILPEFAATVQGKIRIAFFDADSTLRVAPSGSVSANTAKDVALLPLVSEKMAKLASEGYLLGIVSNQLGVSQGHVSFASADGALRRTIGMLVKRSALMHYYDFAEFNNENRKPDIAMAERLASLAEAKLGMPVDWENSFMVGDSAWKKGIDVEPDGTPGSDFTNTDRVFAENVAKKHPGFKFFHPRDFFGWKAYGVRGFENFTALQAFVKQHPELDPRKK